MVGFFFWSSLIASAVIPGAFIGAMKAVKQNQDTKWYTIILSVCFLVIAFTVIMMLRQGLGFH